MPDPAATSLQYLIQSRLALLDVTLSFFISLSLLFFYLGYKSTRKKRYYLLFFISMALATLTKGPVGTILPLLVIGLYLALAGETKLVRKIPWFWGTIIYLVIAAPWYIIEFLRHGKEFLDNFFLLRTFSRYLTPFEGHGEPIWYFIPVLFFGFFPWSGFLPYSFLYLVSLKGKWKNLPGKNILFILFWFGVIFVFFSLAKSKLPGYILPLYPPLALAVGKLWDDWFSKKRPNLRKGLIFSFVLFFLLGLILLLAVSSILKVKFPVELSQFKESPFPLAIVLMASTVISFFSFFWKRLSFISFTGIVVMVFVSTGFLVNYVLPRTEQFKPTKILSNKIVNLIQPGEKIGDYLAFANEPLSFNCSLIYYCDRPVEAIDSEKSLLNFLKSKERVYCTMEKKKYLEVRKKLNQVSFYILDERGKQILISNQR